MIAEKLSMSVVEMRNTLDYDEYTGWRTYLTEKPPSPNEYQMATLMAMVANMFGGDTKPVDFMVTSTSLSREKEQMQPATAFDSFNAIATDYDSRKK